LFAKLLVSVAFPSVPSWQTSCVAEKMDSIHFPLRTDELPIRGDTTTRQRSISCRKQFVSSVPASKHPSATWIGLSVQFAARVLDTHQAV